MQFTDDNGKEGEVGQKPYMLSCGHTICLKCLKQMLQNNIRRKDNREIVCPFDKTKHPITTSVEKDLPINYSLLRGLSAFTSKKQQVKYCSKSGHGGEHLNFYCKSHAELVCQMCLIKDCHLAQKCDLVSSEEYLWSQTIKSEVESTKSKINEYLIDFKY